MGISHILAISGLHVSMIGLGIYRFLRRRGIRYSCAFALSGGLLFLYALLTGASVSTKRAVGMLCLLMLADVWGRAYDSLNALGAMILYLLWENPFLLEYAGFTLSVAAVLGVSTIGTAMQVGEKDEKPDMTRIEMEEDTGVPEKTEGDMRRPGKTKECRQGKECRKGKENLGNRQNYAHKAINAAYMGVGIWLFTLPLVALYYYEIPLYSALLNLFVVPLLKYLILLGAAGALVGVAGTESGIFNEEGSMPAWIHNLVSLILLPCRWILNWYDKAANVCLNLPLARIIVGKPSWARITIYYAAILFFSIIWTKRKEKHWIRLAGGVAILTVLLIPTSREFEVDVLDVGQGDGTYICSEEGVSLFIDGGSTNVSSVGTYRILPFLKSKGIRRISYWFVSHADADHISGLIEVIESGYTIDNLILANRTVQDDSRDSLIGLAQEAGTNVICMKTGDVLDLGSTKITCLSPAADNRYEDRNDGGLVLLYRDAQFSAMFAGDIPSEVEETIVAEYEQDTVLEEQKSLLDVDYYKVNHHGSKYSSGKLWLEALTPEVTTISCSSTNTYGHPHEETLERLSEAGTEIYRTDKLGAIRITLEDGGISVSGYNSQ
jgi:competence protein ComEC